MVSKVVSGAFYPVAGVLKDGTGVQWDNLVANSSNYNLWKTQVDENSFYDLLVLYMYGWNEAEWNAAGSPNTGAPFHFQMNDADLFFTRGWITRTNRTHPFHSSNGPNDMFKNLFIENNPDFKTAFADRVHFALKDDGRLTPNVIKVHYDRLSNMIDTAIVAEAARWGDDPSENPAVWQHNVDTMYDQFMKHRTDSLLKQLREQDLYPSHEPVDYPLAEDNQWGGSPPTRWCNKSQCTHVHGSDQFGTRDKFFCCTNSPTTNQLFENKYCTQ